MGTTRRPARSHLLISANTPVPLTSVHVPTDTPSPAGTATSPASLPETVCAGPASAMAFCRVTATDADTDWHVGSDTVHTKVAVCPNCNPVTVDVGDVGVVMTTPAGEPAPIVHEPVPMDGLVAASVAVSVHMVCGRPATAGTRFANTKKTLTTSNNSCSDQFTEPRDADITGAGLAWGLCDCPPQHSHAHAEVRHRRSRVAGGRDGCSRRPADEAPRSRAHDGRVGRQRGARRAYNLRGTCTRDEIE